MEGIVEAAPQLVLQLYIITRNGIKIEGKYDFISTRDFRDALRAPAARSSSEGIL